MGYLFFMNLTLVNRLRSAVSVCVCPIVLPMCACFMHHLLREGATVVCMNELLESNDAG